MGLWYWILLWVMMGVAFCVAWLFIVKGCEQMDESNANEFTDHESSHH